MTENPYLLMIATGTACIGRAAVHDYYANHFLPAMAPDLELESLSQTIGSDRLVEEMVVRFTHTIEMDWLLPTLRPTGRRAEFIIAAVIGFENSKVAHEHIYWDQATLLSQMGVLDHPLAAAGTGSVGQLSRLR
jgi:carboxymethylenebutenolidase